MSDSLLLFYVTVPHTETGTQIATKLLEKKLIACANILPPHTSIYEWEGKITQDSEHVLILKTTAQNADQVESEITELHPYDCPCIIRLTSVGANKPFSEWITQQTTK